MLGDLEAFDDLYRELILDHCTRPRNFRDLPGANRGADGHNQLCGDKYHLALTVQDGVIRDIAFIGKGCCISKASASMMTQVLKGKTVAEAQAIFARFHEVLTGPPDQSPDVDRMGKLAAFGGVRKFPVRVKCATLPWRAMEAALKDDHQPVSTE